MAQRTVAVRSYRNRERFRRTPYVETSRFRRARAVRASLRKTALVYNSAPARMARFQAPAAVAETARLSQSLNARGEGSDAGDSAPAAGAVPAFHPESAPSAEPPGVGSAEAAEAGENLSSGENEPAESAASPDQPVGAEAGTEEASLYIPRGAMPPPLRGSMESLERQNAMLTAEGLERIENEDDLAARIANGLLVPVPASAALAVSGKLPPNHRYCRPWTARFLADLAAAHDAAFHRPLQVSSAVRTVAYQKRLMWINGNAAPAEGDIVSPHLTGAAVDIAKQGLTRAEMGWMRRRLLGLEAEGKIDVEEEFHQSCFHITVYQAYAPLRAVRRPVQTRTQAPSGSKPSEIKTDATPGVVAAQGQ